MKPISTFIFSIRRIFPANFLCRKTNYTCPPPVFWHTVEKVDYQRYVIQLGNWKKGRGHIFGKRTLWLLGIRGTGRGRENNFNSYVYFLFFSHFFSFFSHFLHFCTVLKITQDCSGLKSDFSQQMTRHIVYVGGI